MRSCAIFDAAASWARVHTQALVVVVDHDAAHLRAGAIQDGEHVGEVILALRVVAVELAEVREQLGRAEAVDAGIALGDLALFVGAILFLDDTAHIAGRGAHDAPVAMRVFRDHGEHGRRVARGLVPFDEVFDGRGTHERGIAAQDDNVALVALELVCSAHDGVARAQHLELV